MSDNEKRPLTSEAYDVIKKRIIDLNYRPGEVLFTQQLANELMISRTPVREALVKLCQDGLLRQTDSRKFQVTAITKESISEIYSLRRCFEIMAAENVFAEISDSDIEIMQGIIEKMKECLKTKEVDAFFKMDNDFHQHLIRKYNNQFLVSFVNQLLDHQQRIRYVTYYVSNRMEDTIEEHQQIVEQIKAGDLKGTNDAIARHLQKAESETIAFLDSKDFAILSNVHTIKL